MTAAQLSLPLGVYIRGKERATFTPHESQHLELRADTRGWYLIDQRTREILARCCKYEPYDSDPYTTLQRGLMRCQAEGLL